MDYAGSGSPVVQRHPLARKRLPMCERVSDPAKGSCGSKRPPVGSGLRPPNGAGRPKRPLLNAGSAPGGSALNDPHASRSERDPRRRLIPGGSARGHADPKQAWSRPGTPLAAQMTRGVSQTLEAQGSRRDPAWPTFRQVPAARRGSARPPLAPTQPPTPPPIPLPIPPPIPRPIPADHCSPSHTARAWVSSKVATHSPEPIMMFHVKHSLTPRRPKHSRRPVRPPLAGFTFPGTPAHHRPRA